MHAAINITARKKLKICKTVHTDCQKFKPCSRNFFTGYCRISIVAYQYCYEWAIPCPNSKLYAQFLCAITSKSSYVETGNSVHIIQFPTQKTRKIEKKGRRRTKMCSKASGFDKMNYRIHIKR